MPYVSGKSAQVQSTVFKVCKYAVPALGCAVPYLYFLEDYVSDTGYVRIALWGGYFIAIFVVERVFTKCLPFMFLLKEKRN
jgi:hypothetical protein